MNGRDEETMDMIVHDLKTAAYGLPVSFRVVPFDTPMVSVYVWMDGYEIGIGSLIWTTDDLDRNPETMTWWTMGSFANKVKNHGKDGLRAGLATLLNSYIDKRVGLL